MNFKTVILRNSLQLAFYWVPRFSNKINAARYSIVEIYVIYNVPWELSIVNENIVKSKVEFKINHASMNDIITANFGYF